MRRRIGVMIGLDLDDDAADAVDQQRRADQVGRHLVHAAGEELRAFSGVAAAFWQWFGAGIWSHAGSRYADDAELR